MRYVISVVGSSEQIKDAPPRVNLRGKQNLHDLTWYACSDQEAPADLLDDSGSRLLVWLRAPLLGYRFYRLVHGTRLWSGARPLILVRGRGPSSRLAAYAGSWGGGDVVMADLGNAAPLRPTRFVLAADGSLKLKGG